MSKESQYGIVPKNYMEEVDFSEAELSNVLFTGGIDLSSIILPKDGSMILIKDLHTALIELSDELTRGLQFEDIERINLFCVIMLTKTQDQKMWIFSKKELMEDYGKHDGTLLFDFLHEHCEISE
jgi:hypothetical protein